MLLEVVNLSIAMTTREGEFVPVRGVSFTVRPGEILGVVGESGCGKSLCNLALMGLLPANARVSADSLHFAGCDLLTLSEAQWRQLRGSQMAMIFQDPLSALNPRLTVGQQVGEALGLHTRTSSRQRRELVLELLGQVGIAAPRQRMSCYPHQLSGGMCQRVMIAQAIAGHPQLLIADEPTTALDVTIQSQILDLLLGICEQRQMAMVFVTHDLGVVANISHRIQVMYAGEVVESATAQQLLHSPAHPYTEALLKSMPRWEGELSQGLLYSLPGMVPDPFEQVEGCPFYARCSHRSAPCREHRPQTLEAGGRAVSCLTPLVNFSAIAKRGQHGSRP